MTMKNNSLRAVLGGVLLCLCSACSSPLQIKQYYTLHSIAEAEAAAPVSIAGGLGIGPVELPEALSGINIVSLVGEQRVDKSPEHLWAGDLQRAISRVLADNLSHQLALDDVSPFPWDTRHRPEKQISVLIEELQGELGQQVTLVAKWSLYDEQGLHLVQVGRQRFSAATGDASYASYVAAINQVINQFSLKLEAQVRQHWSASGSTDPSGEIR
jgi:uncharacterized protein